MSVDSHIALGHPASSTLATQSTTPIRLPIQRSPPPLEVERFSPTVSSPDRAHYYSTEIRERTSPGRHSLADTDTSYLGPATFSRRLIEPDQAILAPRFYSPISRLSPELINRIIDIVAEPKEYDELPRNPQADLASCSLTCHAWVLHSSRNLFSLVHFGPRSRKATVSEGEVEYRRLKDFIMYINNSARLLAFVTGISIHWGSGMPSLPSLVDILFSSIPNLSELNLYRSPLESDIPLRFLPVHRYRMRSVELGFHPDVPCQEWLFQYLRFFESIDTLHLVRINSICWDTDIARTRHLRVKNLHLQASHNNIFQVLKRLLLPASVVKLCIEHTCPWSSSERAVRAINDFLEACGQCIEYFYLMSTSAQSRVRTTPPGMILEYRIQHGYKISNQITEPTALHALRICTQLRTAHFKLLRTVCRI